MHRYMTTSAFFIAAAVFMAGCTASHHSMSHNSGDSVNTVRETVKIRPAGSYEECFSLAKGQVMVYSFSSTRPVNFNVHYHAEDGIRYPVSENDTNQYRGIFDPQKIGLDLDEQDSFCLMWENPEMMQLSISYECSVREK